MDHKTHHFLAKATPIPTREPRAKTAPPMIAIPLRPSKNGKIILQDDTDFTFYTDPGMNLQNEIINHLPRSILFSMVDFNI